MSSIVTEGNQVLRQNATAQFFKHYHYQQGMFIGDWPPPPGR